jgi:hypothetical protein
MRSHSSFDISTLSASENLLGFFFAHLYSHNANHHISSISTSSQMKFASSLRVTQTSKNIFLIHSYSHNSNLDILSISLIMQYVIGFSFFVALIKAITLFNQSLTGDFQLYVSLKTSTTLKFSALQYFLQIIS